MPALELPSSFRIRDKMFRPAYNQQITPLGTGGTLQTIERAAPLWVAQYTTAPLFGAQLGEVEAFLDEMNGSFGTFLGWDPARIMPVAYRHLPPSSDPWTLAGQAAPRITSVNYAARTITLDRLAVGAIISKGDYVSAQIGNAWWLFRSQQTVTVGGTNSVTIIVGPRLPASLAGPVVVRYRKACAEFKIIGKVDESSSVGEGTVLSFNAVQYVRP